MIDLSVFAHFKAYQRIKKKAFISENQMRQLLAIWSINVELGKYANSNLLNALRSSEGSTYVMFINLKGLVSLGYLTLVRKPFLGWNPVTEKRHSVSGIYAITPQGKRVIERYHLYYNAYLQYLDKCIRESDDVPIKTKHVLKLD